TSQTINEIIVEADDLLRQNPAPNNDALEAMKTLLESLVDLHIQVCSINGAPALEIPLSSKIVINEFLPNPIGADNSAMPSGEWVEIYNKSTSTADLAGWYIYDSSNGHDLPISSGNTNTGGTLIAGEGFLVVYRNGDTNFVLNNTGGDSVRLFDGSVNSGNLIDSYIYTVDAPEGKSFARIPDGADNWVDPIPTPGEENNLEGEEVCFGSAISEPDENADAVNTNALNIPDSVQQAFVEQIIEQGLLQTEEQTEPTATTAEPIIEPIAEEIELIQEDEQPAEQLAVPEITQEQPVIEPEDQAIISISEPAIEPEIQVPEPAQTPEPAATSSSDSGSDESGTGSETQSND
ncbi:MAG: lamin tail domain-containing protein, partial [Candidatus Pacebacteria bacterium]|nr:lamin tail domain-containing protein [Candidatus Paceibacterota bacterium]